MTKSWRDKSATFLFFNLLHIALVLHKQLYIKWTQFEHGFQVDWFYVFLWDWISAFSYNPGLHPTKGAQKHDCLPKNCNLVTLGCPQTRLGERFRAKLSQLQQQAAGSTSRHLAPDVEMKSRVGGGGAEKKGVSEIGRQVQQLQRASKRSASSKN